MTVQVVRCGLEPFSVVLEVAQPHVAAEAQDASHLTGLVVMVDVPLAFTSRLWRMTDSTPALLIEQTDHVVRRDPVLVVKVPSTEVSNCFQASVLLSLLRLYPLRVLGTVTTLTFGLTD